MIIRRGLTFDDLLLIPHYTGSLSRQVVSTATHLGIIPFEIPIISANMDTVTGYPMAQAMADLGGLGVLPRFMSIEENVNEYKQAVFRPKHIQVGVSIGAAESEMERAVALSDAGAEIFCLDVAHAHSKITGRMLKALREKLPHAFIIAGNVATYAGADYLASCGADAIKVGIGPGSACTTRIKTGCGVPQVTALMDCRRVDRQIIADGGMRNPGDVVKALAAGADMVMLGGMLAGTDEAPGKIEWNNFTKKHMKKYRGMASKEAQNDFMGSMPEWKTDEGIEFEVPYKGPVKDVIADIVGGLRSGLTYCGARDIPDLQKKAEFIEITNAGYIEGTPHGKK